MSDQRRICAFVVLLGTACGGSSSGLGHNIIATPTDNVAEVVVDSGLPEVRNLNGLFATVTVCVPGTSECQTIEHVLVDTGSTGLRLISSALTLSLPAWTDDNGLALAECGQFVSGFTWGSLRSADFRIAGEQVNDLPIQIIGDAAFPVPNDCTGSNVGTTADLGANGILGLDTSLQDCGSDCTAAPGARSLNPGMYYACSSTKVGDCQAAAVPVAKQVPNPIALFGQDNNGIIVELSGIPAGGSPLVNGALVFGIDTRENNKLSGVTLLRLDGYGTFMTSYSGLSNPALGFADTGSNGIYFLGSATTGIPTCVDARYQFISDFYCPRNTINLSARNQDALGMVTVNVGFSIANAEALFSSLNVAFNNLGGPSSAPSSDPNGMGTYFDWGLPFYFGRNVFTAIEGQSTPAGVGPFLAF